MSVRNIIIKTKKQKKMFEFINNIIDLHLWIFYFLFLCFVFFYNENIDLDKKNLYYLSCINEHCDGTLECM